MPLTITDEQPRAMQMGEQQARAEIACRLFDAGKMSFRHAARLAQLSDSQTDEGIERRGIPRYRYTAERLAQDLDGLGRTDSRPVAGT